MENKKVTNIDKKRKISGKFPKWITSLEVFPKYDEVPISDVNFKDQMHGLIYLNNSEFYILNLEATFDNYVGVFDNWFESLDETLSAYEVKEFLPQKIRKMMNNNVDPLYKNNEFIQDAFLSQNSPYESFVVLNEKIGRPFTFSGWCSGYPDESKEFRASNTVSFLCRIDMELVKMSKDLFSKWYEGRDWEGMEEVTRILSRFLMIVICIDLNTTGRIRILNLLPKHYYDEKCFLKDNKV